MTKRIFYSIIVFVALAVSNTAFPQEKQKIDTKFVHDQRWKKDAFESTMWIPKRGVKLLNEESALKVWRKTQDSDCYIPKLTSEGLKSFDVFQSEHLNIFVFTTLVGTDWTICQKKSNKQEFQADGISGGYKDGNPKKTFDNCSAGSTDTDVRFRSYVKGGPLLLEVHVGGCREGESHHEFLFRLDKEELEEIPGSRLVMHDYYNYSERDRGWMWSCFGYNRLGKVSWNDKGEMIWERFLRKHPLSLVVYGGYEIRNEKYQPSVFKRTCTYNSDNWIVECEDELKKKSFIEHDTIKYYLEFKDLYRDDERTLTYLQGIKNDLQGHLKELGYDMKKEEKNKLEAHIKRVEERIASRERVKTTTR